MRRALLLLALFPAAVRAQEQAGYPTARALGAAVATSTETFRNLGGIRVLSDGRVLVLDLPRRRILLLDSTLQHTTVVADTTPATGNAFGAGLDGLLPWAGDSTLVRDGQTGAFVLLGPDGHVARIAGKAPGGSYARYTNAWTYDGAGGILFREPAPIYLALLPPDFTGDTLMFGPDSVAIQRLRLATGRTDTLTTIKPARTRQAVTKAAGRGRGSAAFNPIPRGDDWVALRDGGVAVVRAADYHVDWVTSSGTMASSPRIPAPRIALTDDAKRAILDSVKAADSVAFAGRSGMPPRRYVEPSDLPDAWPQFLAGNTRSDDHGNVWVVARTPRQPGLDYDVIGRDGLVDRVHVASGRPILGFGPGVVYLATPSADGLHITRTSIR